MADETKKSCGMRCKEFSSYHWKGIIAVIAPIMFLPVMFINNSKELKCLYVVLVMAAYWVSEALPLPVTSLLPIFLFPPLGILDSSVVCQQYFKDTLVMFLLGLMVALSIEYCNLHRRIALRTILLVGCTPRRILFGLTMASWVISLWISNSATTAMMCPIIRAVLEELEIQGVCKMYMEADPDPMQRDKEQVKYPSRIAICFYLSAAYGATFGGCGTLIGTGTNMTLKGLYDGRFPNAVEQIDFPRFMLYMFPPMLVLILMCYVWMCFLWLGLFRPNSKDAQLCNISPEGALSVKKVVEQKANELGTITLHEIQILLCFAFAILLLFFRSPGFMPGWGKLFQVKIKASMPMTLCVILSFMLPIHYLCFKYCCLSAPFTGKQTPSLLIWSFLQNKVPWSLLLLLGGGFAMAEGCIKSGMSRMIGGAMEGMKALPVEVTQLLCVATAVFITAFCANVAACNLLIPVVTELALAVKVHPIYLMFPAGIGCSMAFVLPISTPPNAIVNGFANVKNKDMVLSGLFPTVSAILILSLTCMTWTSVVYPDSGTFPDWAIENTTTKMIYTNI